MDPLTTASPAEAAPHESALAPHQRLALRHLDRYPVECPLRVAMREAAAAAVLQHALYLEGERLPRPELVETLEGWLHIHRLIEERICPALRTQALTPTEVSAALDEGLADCLPPVPVQLSERLRQLMVRCASLSTGSACPLDLHPRNDEDRPVH